MHRLLQAEVFMFLLAAAVLNADIITSTSDPFTFPSFTGIIPGHPVTHQASFTTAGYSSKTGIVTLSWSFPPQTRVQKGMIAVYSLRGQVFKTFPIYEYSGAVKWDASQDGVSGVVIARLTYGNSKQNLRLIICK